MKNNILKVHPIDNVIVALTNLVRGDVITYEGVEIVLQDDIKAKHKFTDAPISRGGRIIMYGVLVGLAQTDLAKGALIHVDNVKHAANDFETGARNTSWKIPDISKFSTKTFNGFHRSDGSVGTANYWLVIPMVFCENRNIDVLEEALVSPLGYGRKKKYQEDVVKLIGLIREGKDEAALLNTASYFETSEENQERIFPNVDGIKFLVHNGGCGGTREDAITLCGLLAGYITHPNVAGATILSLGCQNAQVSMLQDEIAKRDIAFDKPLYILEQQKVGTEADLFSLSIRQTLAGLMQANKCVRQPAPLSKLCIGLECGGSDGFSGISANPAIGYTSDLLVALGGSVILAEFPELCGVEQDLSDRCVTEEAAERFLYLMKSYNNQAIAAGSGFDMNPSPGNIKDGLITDAIKSAGAAKKGGTSPIVAVLDYPEKVSQPGLNLLCTPGNDVESTTAEVASGANIVLFTTGLGTPTGNPVAPVVKLATNTDLFNRMRDIMDINTGLIIEGEETIPEAGERILDYVISVASGETEVAAVRHRQNDFIPWKRGISL
ncbi:MAG: altronate dehydratase family protein [Daejeonella sp.]|uniref:UxaA family hydrolase n=1 Tax=Daejeonella sp. TaxID=2805397 RepID=UPI003C77EE1C